MLFVCRGGAATWAAGGRKHGETKGMTDGAQGPDVDAAKWIAPTRESSVVGWAGGSGEERSARSSPGAAHGTPQVPPRAVQSFSPQPPHPPFPPSLLPPPPSLLPPPRTPSSPPHPFPSLPLAREAEEDPTVGFLWYNPGRRGQARAGPGRADKDAHRTGSSPSSRRTPRSGERNDATAEQRLATASRGYRRSWPAACVGHWRGTLDAGPPDEA